MLFSISLYICFLHAENEPSVADVSFGVDGESDVLNRRVEMKILQRKRQRVFYLATEALSSDQVEEKKQHLSQVEVRCVFIASQRGARGCVFFTPVTPHHTSVFCKVSTPGKKWSDDT